MYALTRHHQFPGVPDYRADLAQTYFNLGFMLARNGRAQDAQKPLGQALKEQEGLLAAAPGNIRYRGAVARTCIVLDLVYVWYQGPPCPEASRAVALAKRATRLEPQTAFYWLTLVAAHYRAGNWKDSIAALQKARELGSAGERFRWFAAMAHWQLGDKEQARRCYREDAEWMDRNAPRDEELLRFRAEASQLLGIKEQSRKEETTAPIR